MLPQLRSTAVRESAADVEALQQLLDRSRAAAGGHLRSIFDDEHALAANDVIAELDGIFEMHLAAVDADGAPLVAPVDGTLFRGLVWFGLPGASVRARLVRHDPRVSASYTDGSFAFIVHGTAHEALPGDHDRAAYDALTEQLYVAAYGPGWLAWRDEQLRAPGHAESFTGWIEPRRMYVKR
jgi:hypothetical protein